MQTRPGHPGPRGQRGFTLGEVLATLAVVGISLSLVVPSLASITRNNLRAGAVNELVTTLHVARSEAITRNARVAICPSTDGETCARAAWDGGWIRFLDANADFQVDGDEAVLGVVPAVAGHSIRTDSFDEAVAYTGSGRVAAPDGGPASGDFTFCANDNGPDTVVVLLSPLGQVALADRRANGRAPDCSLS